MYYFSEESCPVQSGCDSRKLCSEQSALACSCKVPAVLQKEKERSEALPEYTAVNNKISCTMFSKGQERFV